MSDDQNKRVNEHSKDEQLEQYRTDNSGKKMTTNQGLRVSEDEHSLKAGVRGPTLMEDFHFREKMTHFDHERIPERVVHARGFGVHGFFQVYEPMTEYTRAKFLQDPSVKTPVFVRFLRLRVLKAPQTRCGMPEALRQNFILKKETMTLWEITFRCFSFRTQSNFRIWFTRLSLSHTMKCLRLRLLTIHFGILSPITLSLPTW